MMKITRRYSLLYNAVLTDIGLCTDSKLLQTFDSYLWAVEGKLCLRYSDGRLGDESMVLNQSPRRVYYNFDYEYF